MDVAPYRCDTETGAVHDGELGVDLTRPKKVGHEVKGADVRIDDLPRFNTISLRFEWVGIHGVARVHRREHVLEPVLADGELGPEGWHTHRGAPVAEEPHVEF